MRTVRCTLRFPAVFSRVDFSKVKIFQANPAKVWLTRLSVTIQS
jgi:hypothetical protein